LCFQGGAADALAVLVLFALSSILPFILSSVLPSASLGGAAQIGNADTMAKKIANARTFMVPPRHNHSKRRGGAVMGFGWGLACLLEQFNFEKVKLARSASLR
jgi:hypothetical protein